MPVTLKLVTPVKVLQPQQGQQITFVASDGEIGVRQGHAPLVAMVGHGVVELVQADGSRATWAVRGGVAQVLKDEVNVLVDEAVEAGRIDAAKIKARLDELGAGGKASAVDEVAWLRGQLLVAERVATRGKH
jgi:F-type H+-transporting ATPase subunit epsilon